MGWVHLTIRHSLLGIEVRNVIRLTVYVSKFQAVRRITLDQETLGFKAGALNQRVH
jgi:hypothetical protein